jgi:signal transduction histidine kinase
METLRARVLELEARLNEKGTKPLSAPILYEKEEVGFAYHGDKVMPIRGAKHSVQNEADVVKTPLTVGGKAIGDVQVTQTSERPLTQEDMKLANAIAQQASLQIENLQLLAAAERARTEAEEATHQFTHRNWDNFLDAIHNSERIGYMYDQASVEPFTNPAPDQYDHEEAMQVLDQQVGRFFVKGNGSLKEEDKALISAVVKQVGQQVENIRLLADASRARAEAEEATRRLTRQNWETFTGRGETVTGFVYDSIKVSPLGNETLATAVDLEQPLVVRGQSIGQLAVSGLSTISQEARDIAAAIAAQASLHLESLRLNEELQARAAELQTVARVSTTASTALDPDELLQSVVDLTKERFGLYHAHIYLLDETGTSLFLAAGAGEVGRKLAADGWNIPTTHPSSLVANAARHRTPVIANDVFRDRNTGFLSNALLPDTRSEMAVPMVVGDKLLGVFDVQSDKPERFSEDDINIYGTLASQVGIALQNARLYVEQAAAVTQLRELDRLKSAFLANMSHELRTPLNSILGFTDVMLEGLDGDLTQYMDNDLRLIQKNGQHLLHLINDVLDMAKIESGRMNLHPEKFVVHELLDEVTSITSTLASAKNTALFIDDDSDKEVNVYADSTRIRQVMINLVNNAIKFTTDGRIALHVSKMDGARVLITVKDTGIGIPPDHLEAIFQEFTQVDTSTTRKVGGTGLGLPISRRLIEMHGGRLWAESSGIEGEGSTFLVELPVEARITEVVEKKEK